VYLARRLRPTGSDGGCACGGNAHGETPVRLARPIANYDVARFFSDVAWPGGLALIYAGARE
jgi:hypothetical protein